MMYELKITMFFGPQLMHLPACLLLGFDPHPVTEHWVKRKLLLFPNHNIISIYSLVNTTLWVENKDQAGSVDLQTYRATLTLKLATYPVGYKHKN